MQWAVCDREHRHFIPIADATVLRLTHALLWATHTLCPEGERDLAPYDDARLLEKIADIFVKDPLSLAAVLHRLPQPGGVATVEDDPRVVLGRSMLRGVQTFLADDREGFPLKLAPVGKAIIAKVEKPQLLAKVREIFLAQQLSHLYAQTRTSRGWRLVPFAVVLVVQRRFFADGNSLDFVTALSNLLGPNGRHSLQAALEVVEIVHGWLDRERNRSLRGLLSELPSPAAPRQAADTAESEEPREIAKFWGFPAAADGTSSASAGIQWEEAWLSAVQRANRLTHRWRRREVGCRQLYELALGVAKKTVTLKTHFAELLEKAKLDALAEFAAGAGHEINNPLAVISGHAQLLLRQTVNPEQQRMLATIVAQAQRAHEMIADARLFARPPNPVFSPVNYHQLLQTVVEEWTPQARLRHIRLELRTEEEPPGVFEALADRSQLLTALGAVVKNALEAAPENSVVVLSLDGGIDEVVISVTDHGPGIDAAVRAHLFDPFFSGRQAGRGLGLGLSKAWRIVTLHGGRIDVESAVGKATTFRICLPRRPPGSDT
ncbi:MAG: sensor histidine kinase [Thermogutta sp.]